MSDLKSVQIRNGYNELLTKGAGNTVEDGDGVPFDIFNRAFTAGGLVRLPSGLNFNASGGDTLSDYEVGTWTPTVAGGTVSTDGMFYTRIGREVHVTGRINVVSYTDGAGNLEIGGLPFAPLVTGSSIQAGFTGWSINIALISGSFLVFLATAGSFLQANQGAFSGGGFSPITRAQQFFKSDNFTLNVNGTYII